MTNSTTPCTDTAPQTVRLSTFIPLVCCVPCLYRSNTYIDAQRSGMPLISRTEEVAVYSDRNYKKFEQVFINYGEKVRVG